MKNAAQYILAGLALLIVTACGRQEAPRAVPPPKTAESAPLNYHALVIGIGDYAGTGWPQLVTAPADARAIGETLRTRYGFEVTELIDQQATRGNILRTLDRLMELDDHDALFIYYAGHGFYDQKMDEGYWIPYGAQRARMDQPAKEDWLWNSSISRILNASPARHILLVADTCYGGSLFRGGETPDKNTHWYQRARAVPSRYLITSGNLEPVLDSGIRHSVFAQEILNYLQYTDKAVFSASDVAVSIRAKVSEATGQLVRMGPLSSPAHAGGEFVFTRNQTALPEPEAVETVGTPDSQTRGIPEQNPIQSGTRFIRPRILACVGPTGDTPEKMMIRNLLHEKLDAIGGCVLVEREALDTLLQEGQLGRSELADSRVAMHIGKLLPASLILFGEIIPMDNANEIHLRIIDTETSRVLRSVSASYHKPEELDAVCQTLARQIMDTMNQARPLLLPAQRTGSSTLLAEWGKFHGARVGDTFAVIQRKNISTIAPEEIPLGTAQIQSLNDDESIFEVQWNGTAPTSPKLWLKSTP